MSQIDITKTPVSYLFVPANRPERIDKALAAGAGAIIIDLEDAVPPQDKEAARAALAAWLLRHGTPGPEVLVRINGCDTPWYADDVAACRAAGVAGVLFPKAEDGMQVVRLARALGPQAFIIPLIETARGMVNAGTIAAAPQVQRLGFGTVDFQLDMGMEGDGLELLHYRSHLVLQSRLANIAAPADGVSLSVDDEPRILADTMRGKQLGFGAKMCIHPRQVAVVNRAFNPSEKDIEWAGRVVAAAGAAKGAAFALDGKMIDLPVILKAQRILAISGKG